MFPLRSSEYVYSRSVIAAGLIALNVLIFLYQTTLRIGDLNRLVGDFGIVPDQLVWTTLITSQFLHGGWLHLIGNVWFLWVFGRNVEDSLGHGRFLVFYLACGVIAGLAQVAMNPYSRTPTVGASGAIAGVMGAYLIKFPRSSIDTLVLLIVFFTRMAIPAPFFLLVWFGMQFFSGLGSLNESGYVDGGTAWFAHIGGFLAGVVLVRLFPDQREKHRPWYEEQRPVR